MAPVQGNRYSYLLQPLTISSGRTFKFYNVPALDKSYDEMPFCLRILLESVVRNCDEFHITEDDVKKLVSWKDCESLQVPIKPARVIFQDFTGLPALIDLASMRDAVGHLGGDVSRVNVLCPVDLIIDHSPSIDIAQRCMPQRPSIGMPMPSSPMLTTEVKWPVSEEHCPFHQLKTEGSAIAQRNQQLEFERNKERLIFFKWAESTFDDIRVIPPGTGSGGSHYINVEATARCVTSLSDILCPDSVIGTDTHTSVNNALGILSIASGAIEAEAAMLGHVNNVLITGVVGCCISGSLPTFTSSTDIVMAITKRLRQANLSNKLVEFFGPGVSQLSMSDRITIANTSPEYGAVAAFFPTDRICLNYLEQAGWHDLIGIDVIEAYLTAVHLFRDYQDSNQDPLYSQVIHVDLQSIKCCCSGPRRPQDRVEISEMKADFLRCLEDSSSSRGFGLDKSRLSLSESFKIDEIEYVLKHGDILTASITSCTNTSSPLAVLAAGLLAKKAVGLGLTVEPFVKTNLCPGNSIVSKYLFHNQLLDCLQKLRFSICGYGCEKCLLNAPESCIPAITAASKGEIVTVGIMSNVSASRQLDSSDQVVLANYITSPPFVIAYAIAGRVIVDFETEPIGNAEDGSSVFIRDIWPTRKEILDVERTAVFPAMFCDVNSRIKSSLAHWDKLDSPNGSQFPWNAHSTFVLPSPFFNNMTRDTLSIKAIAKSYVLLNLGDSVSTDHISVAGSIPRNTPAARYLTARGVCARDFNSYGSRRGNDAVMVRSMFVNARLQNKLVNKPAPQTLHVPSNSMMEVFDAAMKYTSAGSPLIILAGKDYGVGSPRDWVAKGQAMLGVKAVIAESFDEAHRCGLIGAGILPLQYLDGENASSLNLSGREAYTIELNEDLSLNQQVSVKLSDGRCFQVAARLSSKVELEYYRHGGLLTYSARQCLLTDHSC